MNDPSKAQTAVTRITFGRWARRLLGHTPPGVRQLWLHLPDPPDLIIVPNTLEIIGVVIKQAGTSEYRQAGVYDMLLGLVAADADLEAGASSNDGVEGRQGTDIRAIDWRLFRPGQDDPRAHTLLRDWLIAQASSVTARSTSEL